MALFFCILGLIAGGAAGFGLTYIFTRPPADPQRETREQRRLIDTARAVLDSYERALTNGQRRP